MSSLKKPTVGGHIESQCTKCGMLTNHIVVAMIEDEVIKVQCNTCQGVHRHRPPKAEKTARPARAAAGRRVSDKPSASSRSADREQWEQLTRKHEGAAAAPYSMDAPFRAQQVITHPTFGLGVVLATIKPNKMEVLFEDGRKTLRCSL